MKILTSDQMRNIDRRATEQFAIPSILLMENAALAVADVVGDHFPSVERVSIFCGTGQNGGDGLALARHLESRGVVPSVFLIGDRAKFSGDSKTNLAIVERLGVPIYDATDAESLDQSLARASAADLVVDAIFGTGLNRPAEGLFADAIRGIEALRLPVVAVDIPSGLDASKSEVVEPVVKADFTVTFAQPKIAHIFEPAASYCGEIIVADISIPRSAVEAENVTLSLVTPAEVAPLFPPRAPAAHKGTYGHVAIVSGSPGKSGAAILAARGALRAGAGLVTVVTDPATAATIDAASIESMTFPIELSSESMSSIRTFLENKPAVLVGPGLPDSENSYQLIRELVASIEQPLVLDATAVNAFAGKPATINAAHRPRVITPHPGELARLLGRETRAINADRVGAARETARLTRSIVVLKGHQTLIADPEGFVMVNPTGNPGMATGGMGDVLSGMLAGLLAQGMDLLEAARAAVYVHGFAGDLLRHERSEIGMTAMELADRVPVAIERIRGER